MQHYTEHNTTEWTLLTISLDISNNVQNRNL